MKQFEYMFFDESVSDARSLRDELNFYGRDGWEVISFEVCRLAYIIRIWLKREKETT